MPRPSRIAAFVLGGWLCGAGGRGTVSAEEFVFHHENVMGTSLELRVLADDSSAADRTEERVLAEIDRLAAIFSNHDPSSEFRRWQEAGNRATKVSPELFEVMQMSDRWRAISGGAFDPRAQLLSRLWAHAQETGREPSDGDLAAALTLFRGPTWRLDAPSGMAEKRTEAPLTLDAIAKGYIIERACEAGLKQDDAARGLLLNVGGDLRVVGDSEGTIGVVSPMADSEGADPIARVEVRDRSVATSGRSQRGFWVGGRRYSHILDPRTGRPASGVAGATVIAERSADADALATALNVLAPEEGIRLADSLPGVACLIVSADGRITRNREWDRYERPSPQPLALALAPVADGPSGNWWGDEFELAVHFEINQIDEAGGRYRRPYVVVWIEDEKGYPVRTLLLWASLRGAGPDQWLPDLKRWYPADQDRKKVEKSDLVHTMARPTRPPGEYAVTWDGKDNRGRPLPAGPYTIHVEAAREHGTYQSIRKAVTIGNEPFDERLKGNVEIQSASITYRRKTPPK